MRFVSFIGVVLYAYTHPVLSREQALNESHEWRDWSGYLAASLYEPLHDREYYAIRSSAALIDVSPLYKYEIRGPDAARAVDRIITRDAAGSEVGQVLYTPWCDDDGKVIDDGTVTRLDVDRFRITAAEPNLAWFQDCAYGMQIQIRDVSKELVALALQGPKSGDILRRTLQDIDISALRYYRAATARLRQHPYDSSAAPATPATWDTSSGLSPNALWTCGTHSWRKVKGMGSRLPACWPWISHASKPDW